MDKGKILNWQQACERLGCKKSHFYNLVNSGQLPGYRSGKLKGIGVLELDVEKYKAVSMLVLAGWSKEDARDDVKAMIEKGTFSELVVRELIDSKNAS